MGETRPSFSTDEAENKIQTASSVEQNILFSVILFSVEDVEAI